MDSGWLLSDVLAPFICIGISISGESIVAYQSPHLSAPSTLYILSFRADALLVLTCAALAFRISPFRA